MDTKTFITFINKNLKNDAIDNHASKINNFNENEDFYSGNYVDKTLNNYSNYYNIIQPIIDTKVTYILDNKITTNVKSQIKSTSDIKNYKKLDLVADIENDILEGIKKINNFNIFKFDCMFDAAKMGTAIVKVFWDKTKRNNLGEVGLEFIDPSNFYPDPTAKKIEDCNFIFVKCDYSVLTLKKNYPDMVNDIDRLISTDKSNNNQGGVIDNTSKQPQGILNAISSQSSAQVYTYKDTDQVSKAKKTITIWELYIKDDSIFSPDTKSYDSKTEEVKEQSKFQYPNGRVIIFAGEDVIFEDKPIDYPYGFPFRTFQYIKNKKSIFGFSDVDNLKEIQKRLNMAFLKLRETINDNGPLRIYDPSKIKGDDLSPNKNIETIDAGALNGGLGGIIAQLDNNQSPNIQILLNYISILEENAKKIARVNDQMLSGERQPGINSGVAISSLNDSPMTGIRSIQTRFNEFLIEICEMALKLVPIYYNTTRIIKLSKDDTIAIINVNEKGGIQLQNKNDNGEYEAINEILNTEDLSDFSIEIVSGAEMPRSRTALAQLTQQLAKDGLFGDPKKISTAEIVCKSLDFPDYRALLDQRKKEEEESAKQPPPSPNLNDILTQKNLSISFKDLTPDAQLFIENQLKLLPIQPPELEAPQIQEISPIQGGV